MLFLSHPRGRGLQAGSARPMTSAPATPDQKHRDANGSHIVIEMDGVHVYMTSIHEEA